MNVIYTVLFAFPIGFFVKQRGLAIVSYLAIDAIVFSFQTLNVLHDSWLTPDGRVDMSNGDLLGYGASNLATILIGVGLVILGTVVAARRASKRDKVTVA